MLPFVFGCGHIDRDILDLPGIVETHDVRLSSEVGGRVEKVFVSEGQHVDAGQQLVELDCEELQAKRAQLVASEQAAQAKWELSFNGPLPEQIAASRSAVDAAEARLARLVAGWRTEEVEMAKQDAETWKAEYDKAKSEFHRLQSLKPGDIVSLTDIEAAKAAMLKSESQFKSVSNRWNMLVSGTRPEEISEARAELARAKSNYDLVKRGTRDEELRIAKAQVSEVTAKIQEIDVMIKECVVVAPGPCLIEVVSVRRGDVAAPHQPIVRVLYNDDLWVKAYVPETQLSQIHLDQAVTIRHDGSKTEHAGVISQIANVSEFTPRNVQSPEERHHQVFAIKVRIVDTNTEFKSGMAARVRIPISKHFNAN